MSTAAASSSAARPSASAKQQGLLVKLCCCCVPGASQRFKRFEDEPSADFRQRMDSLNRFMKREEFPPELQYRLRGYFHQSRHLRYAQNQHELIVAMPPSLQGEVAWMTSASVSAAAGA